MHPFRKISITIGSIMLVQLVAGPIINFALIGPVEAASGFAALLLLYAVATPLLGQPINFDLLAPMGLAQLAVGLWLLARGFGPSPAGPSAAAA